MVREGRRGKGNGGVKGRRCRGVCDGTEWSYRTRMTMKMKWGATGRPRLLLLALWGSGDDEQPTEGGVIIVKRDEEESRLGHCYYCFFSIRGLFFIDCIPELWKGKECLFGPVCWRGGGMD